MNKWSLSLISLAIVVCASVVLFGFISINKDKKPIDAYIVYLDGKKIGAVESKSEFDDFINNKEDIIKKTYSVDKVYAPKGVEIRKVTTYDDKINSNDEIYNIITEDKKFSIKGTIITIKSVNDDKDDKDKKKDKEVVINVLDKKVFDDAMEATIKAFVDKEKYEKYLNGEQEEIKDTGRIIENIDVKDKITYKNDLINVDEKIFTSSEELSRYLLYGTLDKQDTYVVKEGDTIEDVANSNKLNVAEFLIANPEFKSENNLLYPSQEVVVGLIDPLVNIVVEYHSVEKESRKFETEIKYDENELKGYQRVERAGENGLYSVVRKYQYINGQVVDTATISSTELKPAVSKIIVKGDKYVPEVADLSYWAWPTVRPYVITTYYGYRWGSMHAALDISCGYASDIYAANNGVVITTKGGCTPGYLSCNGRRGNYIVINHNAGGYYTEYMHLSQILVSPGQTVARGQLIARMGNTGEVYPVPSSYSPYSGTHLHFALYKGGPPHGGGYPINPLGLY